MHESSDAVPDGTRHHHGEMSDGLYREFAPAPELAGHVQCMWRRRIGPREALRPIRIVPDGCMDLMWIDGQLTVAGPDTTAQISRAPSGLEFVGLRFRPGAGASILGVPASELVDARADAAAILGRRASQIVDRLESAESAITHPADRRADIAARLLQEAVRRQLAEAPATDRVVQHLVASVERNQSLRIDHLADRVGLSQRQLHRRCCAALGYGPKTFARIVRFQRFLAAARRPGPRALVAAALQSGFADQPHLTREVRQLAGLPPAQLVDELEGRLANRSTEFPSGSWTTA
jgi:AraC-like DNA-binding protein